MTEELISKLKTLTQKIDSELDALHFVRIYLDALGIEDRDTIYDALAKDDLRFKDIFVARIPISLEDFNIHNGSLKIGSELSTLAREKNYHGILYIGGEEIYIPTSSFVPRNGTAAIPSGRNLVSELHERSNAGEQIHGVLEIRTEKYQEPAPCIKRVELGKSRTPLPAVVNTELFPQGE